MPQSTIKCFGANLLYGYPSYATPLFCIFFSETLALFVHVEYNIDRQKISARFEGGKKDVRQDKDRDRKCRIILDGLF